MDSSMRASFAFMKARSVKASFALMDETNRFLFPSYLFMKAKLAFMKASARFMDFMERQLAFMDFVYHVGVSLVYSNFNFTNL